MSPVFTAAATLTPALGIGGTTAVFTMIHAVMLRSLPVSDPALLYRIGDGDDCCVEGGPQDRWGMFSFPLYERLKAQAPEFEEVAAFQAGGARLSVRREGSGLAAKPLRSEYVTGIAQRPARPLDSRATGAAPRRRWRFAAPVCWRMVAGNWPLATWRIHGRHGASVDLRAAAMDGT